MGRLLVLGHADARDEHQIFAWTLAAFDRSSGTLDDVTTCRVSDGDGHSAEVDLPQ